MGQLRPPAPALPRSLSAPLTVETIESVGLRLLWSVLGLLALALLLAPLRTRAGSTSWRLSKGPARRSGRAPRKADVRRL